MANDELHPLFNSVVLHTVFKHLPNLDWKSGRLVNKTWYLVLLPQWRKQTVVVFEKVFSPSYLANYGSNVISYSTFPRIPFHSCRISFGVFLDSTSKFFWILTGHWLKQLNLNNVRISRVQCLKNILFECTPNLEKFSYENCTLENVDEVDDSKINARYTSPAQVLPNLKSVSIKIFQSGLEEYHPFPISWMNLFSTFQNIEKIRLNFWPAEIASMEIANVVASLGIIRDMNKNKILNITEFIVPYHVQAPPQENILSMNTLTDLCNLSLPISTLATIIPQNPEGLVKILTGFCYTLKQLTFDSPSFWVEEGETVVPFPIQNYQMFPEGLTKLDCQFSPLLPTLGFLAYTPNLIELKIRNGDCNDVVKDIKSQSRKIAPLVHMKNFEYFVTPRVNQHLAKILIRLMPNLTAVGVDVDADAFPVICHGWTKMQQARISLSEVSEECFVDHIISLKCLRSIVVTTDASTVEPLFGDKSIYEGLLKLPLLTTVSVNFSNEVSEEAKLALQAKVHLNFDDW